jgi:hypothetical protein
MKGQSYVPKSGIPSQLEWHWNDGIYTFGNRKDILKEEAVNRAEKSERHTPHKYVWRTSVPKEWYKFKPPQEFVNVRQTEKGVTSLEFLGETQKYIHQICHSKLKLPSQPVVKPPKVIVGKSSPSRRDRHNPPSSKRDLHQVELSVSPSSLPKRLKSSVESLPAIKYQHTPSSSAEVCKLVGIDLELAGSFDEHYKITRYSLPKALSVFRRDSTQSTEKLRTNSQIDEFLGRFDKPHIPPDPPKQKIGMDGWKLAKIKGPSASMHKNSSHQVLLTPKLTRNTHEETQDSRTSEVYFEYLNYKKWWADQPLRRKEDTSGQCSQD